MRKIFAVVSSGAYRQAFGIVIVTAMGIFSHSVESTELQDSPSSLAHNQPTLKVGDGTIVGRRLSSYDNAYVVTQRFTDGRSNNIGIWTDQLQIRDVQGSKVFVRTQGLSLADGRNLSNINTFDPESLAPISNIQNDPDGTTERWLVSGNHVKGRISYRQKSKEDEERSFDTKIAAYDFNCCMRGLFIAALPLKIGLSITLPAIVMTKGDPETVTYNVVGREVVQAGSRGKRDTWIVDSPLSTGGNVRFWVSDKAPYIIRYTLPQDENKHSCESFDML